jgi:hypothetical protein
MTTSASQQHAELNALRSLETAVRSCGLPTMMVSGQPQLERLARALKDIEAARAVNATADADDQLDA